MARVALQARTVTDCVAYGDSLALTPCGDWIEGLEVPDCLQVVTLGVLVGFLHESLGSSYGPTGDRLFWQFWMLYALWLDRLAYPVPAAVLQENAGLRHIAIEPGDQDLLARVGLLRSLGETDTPSGPAGLMPLLNCVPCAGARLRSALGDRDLEAARNGRT